MIYTIGMNTTSKTRAVKLATLQAIVSALDIRSIQDWRSVQPPDADELRESFDGRYAWGDSRNVDNISAIAMDHLRSLTGSNVLLLFEDPRPGACKRHSDLALPLSRAGVPVSHIFGEEVIEAGELQRSMDQDDTYACTDWRPAIPTKKKLDAIEMPDTVKPTSVIDNSICLAVQRGLLGNSKKLSVSKVQTDADKAMLRLSKALLDSPELEAVRSLDGRIKKYLDSICVTSILPHTKSVWFVPLGAIKTVQSHLLDFAIERGDLVTALVAAYPQRQREAERKLASDYNAEDYVKPEAVAAEFRFDWQWLEFSAPGALKRVDAKMFEEEKARRERDFAEATEAAKQMLRTGMAQMVDHMVDRLTDSKDGRKKFNDTLVTNINDFLATFDMRNITDDVQLKALVDRARNVVKGIDADVLRNSDTARAYVARGFEQVKEKLDSLLVNVPRRGYRMNEE